MVVGGVESAVEEPAVAKADDDGESTKKQYACESGILHIEDKKISGALLLSLLDCCL